MSVLKYVITPFVLLVCFLFGCSNPTSVVDENQYTAQTFSSIYWSDGDSGSLGDLKFRLSNVDAPETGGVGAAIGGAKCEYERKLAYDAKGWVVEFTRNAKLRITKTYGDDRYERLVVDLSANGVDVAQAGIKAGHFKPWLHDGRKALTKRPVWCLH